MKYIHCNTAEQELDYLLRKRKCCYLEDDEYEELEMLEHADVIAECYDCGEPIFENEKFYEDENGNYYCVDCKKN